MMIGLKEYFINELEKYTPDETVDDVTQDEVNAEILLNQVTIMSTQAEQDEVLAEILLGQQN